MFYLCEFGEVHDHSMQCGVIKKIQHQGKTRFEKNNFLIFYYSANINRNAKSWNKSQIALLMAETNLAHIRITSTDKLEINARTASCPTQTVQIRCQLSIPVLSLSLHVTFGLIRHNFIEVVDSWPAHLPGDSTTVSLVSAINRKEIKKFADFSPRIRDVYVRLRSAWR